MDDFVKRAVAEIVEAHEESILTMRYKLWRHERLVALIPYFYAEVLAEIQATKERYDPHAGDYHKLNYECVGEYGVECSAGPAYLRIIVMPVAECVAVQTERGGPWERYSLTAPYLVVHVQQKTGHWSTDLIRSWLCDFLSKAKASWVRG